MPHRVEIYDLMTFDEKTKVGTAYWFVCPGCGQGHRYVNRTDGGSPSWEYSGTPESPTFSPHCYANGEIVRFATSTSGMGTLSSLPIRRIH